jgi:hypothetical protein
MTPAINYDYDISESIKLVTDKYTAAIAAIKLYNAMYQAFIKSHNLDATSHRNLINNSNVVHKLNAYNAEAAAFVEKFSCISSNNVNVSKTLDMIAFNKTSVIAATAEFTRLLNAK